MALFEMLPLRNDRHRCWETDRPGSGGTRGKGEERGIEPCGSGEQSLLPIVSTVLRSSLFLSFIVYL